MRWRSRGWDFDSTLQVRILPSKEKSIISFHHEKLQSGQQREELKKHWSEALEKLSKLVF